MDTVEKSIMEAVLGPGSDSDITPEHRAWMNAQIRATLEKKARGKMTYTPLDEIRRKFGLDAP